MDKKKVLRDFLEKNNPSKEALLEKLEFVLSRDVLPSWYEGIGYSQNSKDYDIWATLGDLLPKIEALDELLEIKNSLGWHIDSDSRSLLDNCAAKLLKDTVRSINDPDQLIELREKIQFTFGRRSRAVIDSRLLDMLPKISNLSQLVRYYNFYEGNNKKQVMQKIQEVLGSVTSESEDFFSVLGGTQYLGDLKDLFVETALQLN